MSAQGKLRKVEGGYAVWCQGCEEYHVFDERWQFNGDFDKPTFTPSYLVKSTRPIDRPGFTCCHSFITDGTWHFLSDCTHVLKGQNIPLRNENNDNYGWDTKDD